MGLGLVSEDRQVEKRFWDAVYTLVADATDAHLQLSFLGDRVTLHVSGLTAEGEGPHEIVADLAAAMGEEIDEAQEVAA